MLTTTPGFQDKINSHARKLYGKIIINYTDVFLDPTIDADSSDENYVTQTDQLVNGRLDMTYKYFELNGIATLDNNYSVLPDTAASANFNEMGWWTNSRSSATGVIDVSATVTFSSRSVSAFYLAGDDKRNEYAVDFNVKFYNGASLVYTETVTGNTEVKKQWAFTQINNITSCVINITKWSAFETPVKIAEFTTQVIEEYTGENLCQFGVIEEREISNDNSIPSGNISSSQANICLINEDRKFDANNLSSRLYGLVKPNAMVEIFIGVEANSTIEYIPCFTGWVTEWEVPDESKRASTTARDRLNLLIQTKITTSTVQTGLTFYDWFEVVLNDAGLANTEYNIDTALDGSKYVVPFGWFENVNHRQALETLSQGCSATVWVDKNNIVQIKPIDNFNATSQQTFTRDDYTNKDNKPVYGSVVNNVSVTTQPLLKTTGQTVYETGSSEPETAAANTTTTVTIYYSDQPITDHVVSITPAVSGLSITGQNNYAWGSEIEVTNTNGTDTNFQLKVVGSTYTVSGQKTVTAIDSTSIEDNGEIAFNYPLNPFLQSKDLATEIANNLVASFKDAQRDLSIEFGVGGNPSLELGDVITVTDRYQSKDYKIISTEMNYDGGLSMSHKGRV